MEIRQVEERLRNFQAQSVDLAGQKEALLKELENIEIRELQIKLDELMKIHLQKEDKLNQINSEIEELASQRTKMEAINLSIDYKQYEADKNGIDELLDKLTSANYDEKRITSELANTICLLSNRVIRNLEEELHTNESSLKQENEKKHWSLAERYSSADILRNTLFPGIGMYLCLTGIRESNPLVYTLSEPISIA